MVAIIWMSALLFSAYLLKCFDSMKTYSDEGSSTSVVEQSNTNQQLQHEGSDNKKKILVLADAFLEHYNFSLNLANVLKLKGEYEVYFVVVNYKIKNKQKLLSKPTLGVHFVEIISEEYAPIIETDWKTPYSNDEEYTKKVYNDLFERLGFYTFSLFEAILKNPSVQIHDKQLGIYDWLKENVEHFALGISEFSVMSGAFFLFNEIGLEKYIATTYSNPYPVHLNFLGQKFYFAIPELFMARMFMNNSLLYGSDKSNNEHKYINSVCKLTEFYYGKRNHPFKKYLELVNKYNLEKKEMPKIQDLLRKSKYYLINVHQFGKYFVEENSENQETFSKRIVYIGGIGVEIEGKIKQKNINEKIKRKRAHYKNKMKNLFNGKNKQTISLNVQNNIGGNLNFISGDEKELNWIKTEKCLVIFSFGESVDFESFSREHIKVLVETFENHKECKFIVRNGTFAINNYNSVNINFQRINKFSNVYMNKKGKNILLFDGMIDQQKILAQKNVKCFVTDGSQNNINEALYTGVPLFVIPSTSDQHFNARLIKFMDVGIVVLREDFIADFSTTFGELMKDIKKYSKNARNVAKAIHSAPFGQINKFLETVKKAIDDVDEGPFPPIPNDIQFVDNNLKIHSEVVKEFLEKVKPNVVEKSFKEKWKILKKF